MKTYFTLSNTVLFPYMVQVNDNKASIYLIDENAEPTHDEFKNKKNLSKYFQKDPILVIKNIDQVFVGKDVDDIVEEPGLSKNFWYGNGILIKIKNKKQYVYIGIDIIQFQTTDTIKKFYSVVTRNNSCYPIAFGNKYVYILRYKKRIDISTFEMIQKMFMNNKSPKSLDIYDYLEKLNEIFIKNLQKLKIIHNLGGNENYTCLEKSLRF